MGVATETMRAALVLASLAVAAASSIPLATFDGADKRLTHKWKETNDPVMGGASNGTFSLKDGVAIMDGNVNLIPRLQAPGFIKFSTYDNLVFPDVSSCKALSFVARSTTQYTGYRVSFGTAHAPGAGFFARGYKAPFSAPMGDFSKVTILFEQFSDYWDDGSGKILRTCEQDKSLCPNKQTLENISPIEFWAEGVLGAVHLEVKSIQAEGCSSEVAPMEDATLYKISGSECGQATLDAKYASYAKKFAGLSEGTCASQGYTVADGTTPLKVPVLGQITISKFKKPSLLGDGKCCVGKCTTPGEEKYWSIASGILGKQHCGEACMKPSDYNLYHFFEKNLTKSDSYTPCHDFGFTEYDSTPTHGFGPVKMTLDLYNKPSVASTEAVSCPGSPSAIHAKATVSATFTEDCTTVQTEILARAKGSVDGSWIDPHNKGVYTVTSSSGSSIALSHLTGNKKYTDKLLLTFSDTANGGCSLTGCSESQVFSVLDMSTNYCNLHDLYCSDSQCHVIKSALHYTEEVTASSRQHDMSKCYVA